MKIIFSKKIQSDLNGCDKGCHRKYGCDIYCGHDCKVCNDCYRDE